MRTSFFLAVAMALTTLPLMAQSVTNTSFGPFNRVSLSYRMGLNITADFKGLGGFAARTDPGANTLPGQSRQYDDGYVQPDIRGLPNLTWNWGYYNRATPPPGTASIDLHSSSSGASAVSSEINGDPQP
jgi:hypothetical protein